MRRSFWISLALAVTTLAIYAPLLFHDFVEFDDTLYVTNKPLVQHGLTWEGVLWAFTNFEAKNWHPVTWLSHMLDCLLFGMFPGGHHLSSLALHALNTALLFLLLRRMTGATWRSALVAALFAWHPLHVESVAWVAERKDVLSTFFMLVTIWAYIRYAERPRWGRYAWVLAWYAAGLMSKPMLVTLPCLLLLLDYWPLGRICQGSVSLPPRAMPFTAILEARLAPLARVLRRQPSRATELGQAGEQPASVADSSRPWCCGPLDAAKRMLTVNSEVLMDKLPMLFLAGLCGVMTLWAQQAGGAMRSLEAVPLGLRAANACVAYVTYLWKTLAPQGLAVFYPFPQDIHVGTWLAAALVLGFVTWIVVRRGKLHPFLFVGWLWFVVSLLPVIGLVQVGGAAYADRYTYVPLIGVFMLLVWTTSEWADKVHFNRAARIVAAAAVCLTCAWGTAGQLRHWRNGVDLFSRAVAVTENNYLAHNNLGAALSRQGFRSEGMQHYALSWRLNPRFNTARLNLADAHYNLGVDWANAGDYAQAEAHFTEARTLRPDDPDIHSNLGAILARQAQYAEAAEHFAVAARLQPRDASARLKLAMALEHNGQLAAAIREYRKALHLRPQWQEAQAALDRALARSSRP